MKRKHRCFALFSGGLDSMLAAKYMHDLGYEVRPIFFKTPFFGAAKAQKAAEIIGLDLIVHDLTEIYLPMLRNPRYGFGKNMNPCIDCHGLMFRTAGELMDQYQVDFLISGEVLGQRPMSQRRDAMNSVGKLSGKKDLLVRPLSQKLLSDTLPIRAGWVQKEEMLDIQGRGRYRQIELAEKMGISDFEMPGGGCLLTDVGYGKKLADLYAHQMLELKYINLLPAGRHFRISPTLKLIVGKDENDNAALSQLSSDQTMLLLKDYAGPLAVIQATQDLTADEMQICANILLRYSNKAPHTAQVEIGKNHRFDTIITAHKMANSQVEEYIINKG
ncbi:MAG: tRNA (5-methylaminomethyl-2-thiouridylate)-methyltransferase [Candidatus Cloacimonadales bacterium]